jgi:hypothetical protein
VGRPGMPDQADLVPDVVHQPAPNEARRVANEPRALVRIEPVGRDDESLAGDLPQILDVLPANGIVQRGT